MKPISKLWLSLFLLLPFMGSCMDEDIIKQSNHDIEEGVPVNVALDFNVGASKVVTREASSATAEQTVNKLYVFVFNSDGSLDASQLFNVSNRTGKGSVTITAHSGYDKRIYAIANHESGSGTLSTEELEAVQTEADLLDIASTLQESTNIERVYFLMSGKLKPAAGSAQVDINEQGNILGSENTIKLERVDARITFRVKGESQNPNFSDFVFTADRYWVEQIPQGTYVFPNTDENGQPKDYAGGYASMSTEHETVVFEGVESSGENAGYNVFEFYIPENRLTPKERIVNNDGEAENLYAMREKREKSDLAELDPNKPGMTEENGEFKYANANSTYVVFRGVLSYTDNSESTQKYVNANVTFTVHLGNTGKVSDADNVEKVNNYNTERNTHYTYTVTVTGINSMEVEVKEDKEVRPGMEGDVIVAGAEVKSMDSHYGRTHFTLTRGAIKQGLSWAINTPFQQGMKVFVPEYHEDNYGNITEDLPAEKLKQLQTDLNLNDYKWVQFVINKEALKRNTSWGQDDEYVSSDEYAKYPGYRAYDGGHGTTEPAPAFGSATGYHYEGRGYNNNTAYYAEDVKLYDVNQLINHLYVEANNTNSTIFDGDGDNATVAITAFVDEYVYIYDPTEVYYVEPVPVTENNQYMNLELWKRVVNGSNRMLHLCTSKEIYSPDGNTSLAESVVTISQKPIYTFYDPTKEDVKTAWGTESMMETDRLPVDKDNLSTTYDNTHSNGRENTLNILPRNSDYNPLRWTNVLNVSIGDWGKLKYPYNTIWFACLGRNRDLDGDDIVDADEIRWYIASIDQLTDLWIGQNSLNESAHLYQGPEANGLNRLHVASSSYFDTNTSYVWVIWAEEGASRGSSNAAAGHDGYPGNKYEDDFEYRCVRNLGLSLNNTGGTADDYVATSTNTYYNGSNYYLEYVIDVSRLESNSLRSSSVAGNGVELPAHHERQGMNRPYKKFAVLRRAVNGRDYNVLYPDEDHDWYYYQTNSVCPDGYRTPNQRELMLMYTSLTNENTQNHSMTWGQRYMTCTGFSFNDNELYDQDNSGSDVHRPGFVYGDNNMQLVTIKYREDSSGNETITDHGMQGRIRCVRDVTD